MSRRSRHRLGARSLASLTGDQQALAEIRSLQPILARMAARLDRPIDEVVPSLAEMFESIVAGGEASPFLLGVIAGATLVAEMAGDDHAG